ncbi:MAG TPA: hypothetical protein VJZ26_19150 [Blastocatellia bacterium]|nr:hypothetical protein [Blastocatellia bacterium]
MKDDYLWDGSGDPDPEVERLEKMLGRYRYEPKPLNPAFDQQLLPRRTRWWPRLAVAAAIILMALAGIWVVKQQHKNAQDEQTVATVEQPQQQHEQPGTERPGQVAPAPKPFLPAPKATANKRPALASNRKPERKIVPDEVKPSAPDRREPARASEVASVQPLMNPFLDVETARHIEQAQLFFRSFRNARDGEDFDADYEKRRSRELLSQNAVLRRGAEAKGNLPVQELLGSVEPFLLDIANLPDKPTGGDVRSIKERMQKKEIIATLQIYSAPMLGKAF